MAFFIVLLDGIAAQRQSTGTTTLEQYEFIIELYCYAKRKSTIPVKILSAQSIAQLHNFEIL